MEKLSKPSQKDIQSVQSHDVLESLWNQEFATTYELKNLSESTLKYFSSLNNRLKKGILLDNGCGTARIKKFFEERGWTCFGSDITREGLKVASRLSPTNLIYAPAHDLPFKGDFFDAIIFWRVLHNITKKVRKKSVIEASRVLKKNGILVCCVQSKEDKDTYSKYKENGIELDDDPNTFVVNQVVGNKVMPYMKHFYSKNEIIKELEENTHLEVVRIKIIEEKSGFEAVGRKIQKYWIIEAIKQ
ncbi:MAG: class I SAM-dependent methyltransferase [Candidatus Aenigmarchaeota archaeon]|nr:class I SAM-dependent methyltransferase [Candidatus Aenigmarchaeota archaeon]